MILLDWTRMGKTYCLAGVVAENGAYRVVRPILARHRDASVRNAGWSPYLVDGHSRWEVFELIAPEPAAIEPPHLEDLWVRVLQSRRRLADPGQRQAILTATLMKPGETLFGVPLSATRSAAYLPPGTGQRSLATLTVASREIAFTASQRDGTPEPDVRVRLPLPGLCHRPLPVKDHHLLLRAERASTSVDRLLRHLARVVQQMGEQVAVRLGLSRPYQPRADGPGYCWLMVDGFFSLSDPQP
jgi:hypothetical protein